MYLGRSPAIGTQRLLDSIESQFNGALTTFDLRYGGVPTYPTLSESLIVSLGGVLQEPGAAYYASSDKIVFSEAPATGSECWIMLYSQYGASTSSAPSLALQATGEPMGFENRTHSTISFASNTRTFSIGPNTAAGHSSYAVWTKGTKRTISATLSVQVGTSTGLYYIYFDAFGVLQSKTTYFTWDTETPVAYVYWNGSTSSAPFVADERHGIVLDWATHEYLHRTRGAVIAEGFSISAYTTTGDGSADAHAQFDLGNGTFFDEDLEVAISHSASPTVGTFTQVLTGAAEIPVFYLSGSSGAWVRDTPTEYACKQSATTLQYNLLTGSTWSTTPATNNRYVVSWVVATNDITAPIIAILGQDQYTSIGGAEAVKFGDLVLTNFPIVEFRPLWKVIFKTSTSFTNTPNALVANILDLRQLSETGEAGTVVSDHGLLSGLADDDHSQYLHASLDRAGVEANISTTGNLGGANLTLTGQLQGPANFIIDPAPVGDDTGTVEIKGNLTVQGLTTTINSTTLTVDDKNIVLGDTASPTDALADGGGITLKGSTDKTIAWLDSTDAWTVSEHVSIASAKEYRIAGTKVLDATGLGSAVVGSSLTSVGTIASGTWQGGVIAGAYGGTGVANTGKTITLGGDLTTSGNFALTLTTTAATSVTLPTTGTLIASGAIINADVNASAAIAGTKISPDFGSQNITTAGYAGVGTNSPAERLHLHAPGDNLAVIRLSGTAANHTSYNIRQGTVGVSNSGFSIYDVASAATRICIGSAGNVGIGRTNPGYKLDVDGSIQAYSAVVGSSPYILLQYDVTPANGAGSGRIAVSKSNQNSYSGKIHLQPQYFNGSSYAPLENALVVDATGGVGIGINTPEATLDISDSIKIRGQRKSYYYDGLPPNYPANLQDRLVELTSKFAPSAGTDVLINNTGGVQGDWQVDVVISGDLNGYGVGVSRLTCRFQSRYNHGAGAIDLLNIQVIDKTIVSGTYYGTIPVNIAVTMSGNNIMLTIGGSTSYTTGIVNVKWMGSGTSSGSPTSLTLPGTTTSSSWVTETAWSTDKVTGNNILIAKTGDTERVRITSTGTLNFKGAGTAGSTQAVSFDGSAPVNSLVLNSSGLIGIGTSAPNYQLHVTTSFAVGAAGFNQQLSFTNDTIQSLLLGTGYTPLKLNPLGGNVGIGTTSPSEALHVKSTSGTQLVLERDGTTTQIASVVFKDGSGDQNRISSSDSNLIFGSGAGNTERARIRADGMFEVKGAGVAGTSPALSVSGSAPANSLVLDSSGRVGIGNASPLTKLHINLTGSAVTPIVNVGSFGASGVVSLGSIANNSEKVYLGTGEGVNGGVAAGIGFEREAGGWNSALSFYTNNVTLGPNGVSAIQEKMRITSSGNVGISTSAPNRALEINANHTVSNTVLPALRLKTGSAAGALGYGTGIEFTVQASNNAEFVSAEITSTYTDATNFAGDLRFSTKNIGANSTERARIRADGMFEVKGAGVAGTSPALSVSGSAPANSLVLDSSGRVGIGTTNPTSNLQVIGSTELSELNLSGISSSISSTAVDVFVYDTRKDSDGGAWRKRTQSTSWYNETLNTATRGARKEFPAVAVIVATTNTITIYDGDDPDMPMWMVFNSPSTTPYNLIPNTSGLVTSITALNGKISLGYSTNYGLGVWDFISEFCINTWRESSRTQYAGNIAERNSQKGTISLTSPYILSYIVNDVAMTVLPNAPIDAATGLPVPTIAVATAGGVSVIKDDGSVVNITGQTEPPYRITFNKSNPNEIITSGYWTRVMKIYNIPSSNVSESTQLRYYVDSEAPKLPFGGGALNFESSQTQELSVSVSGGTPANGFYKIAENLQSKLNGMTAYIRTDCNTGWMHGDIKGAFLSDTSTASVTGTELWPEGDFADANEWSSAAAQWTISGGTATVNYTGGGYSFLGTSTGTLTNGKKYILSFTVSNYGAGGRLEASQANSSNIPIGFSANGSYTQLITYTGTTGSGLGMYAYGGGAVGFTLDNLYLRELEEQDRSVNVNGLAVYGTITKTAVAAGSNLVGYSGFSESDYLKQPHNSSLEFGTGSFSCTVWFKSSTADVSNYKGLVYLNQNGIIGEGFQILLAPSNGIYFYIYGPTNDFAGTSHTGYNDGNWHQISVSSTGTHQRVYLDGVLKETGNITTGSITDTSSELFIGKWYANTSSPFYWRGSIALCRISGSIPSPSQILKIYNDEKMLFQENSQATLYGSSDAVTALAYDDTTGLLSVGTSSGRSDFSGLKRINNTTTAVTTAISASNGLIAEQ